MTGSIEKKRGCALRELLGSPKNIAETAVTLLFTFASLWVLIYYITGPALGYFHSDCADSLLWSQAMIDSGKILTEDFSYAAILPFGSPFFMVPMLKLFGYTMKAQSASMCIFAVIFILSSISFFRAMKWKYSHSSLATFCLVMMLSGSVKLREIMWEHVIYYSLGIIFLLLVLNLVIRLSGALGSISDGGKKGMIKVGVLSALLLLLCAGISTDGFQVLALSSIPVLGGIAATVVFDKENKLISKKNLTNYAICAIIAVGTIGGMVILNLLTNNGAISASYADAYSTWSDIGSWNKNAELFLEQFLTLTGIKTDISESLFSGKSILMFLKILGSLIVLVCPFVMLFRYKHLDKKEEKLLVFAHLVLTAVTVVVFVCGGLSGANWRLTPFLGSSIILTLAFFKHMLSKDMVLKRVGVILLCVILCVSLLNAKEILDLEENFGKDDPLQTLADTLEEKGYTRGYATFWYAAETTLRSDSSVNVVTISADYTGVYPRGYQTMSYWFEDVEGQENYFLILDQMEYDDVTGMTEFLNELPEGVAQIDSFNCGNFHVLVFNGNIF